MTLKLIDKDLRSKYAEALYKNESSYDKDIDRRFQRLNIDQFRSLSMVDASSQVFLNKVRQKRTKWIQDDLKFRDHYKLICRNVHSKKLDNLLHSFDVDNKRKWDQISQYKFNLLQQQMRLKDMNKSFISDSEPQINTLKLSEEPPPFQSTIPKLPHINSLENDFNDLYSKYSVSDREFIDKFPAKVELTVTDVGKQYISSQRQKHLTLKKQKQKYTKIQDNALKDSRFKNLISSLDE